MSAHRRLARVLGVDPRLVTDELAARFLTYEHERELELRGDELRCAINARPDRTDLTTWQRIRLGYAEAYGGPRYSRQQIEEWLTSRLLYLPERLNRERRS